MRRGKAVKSEDGNYDEIKPTAEFNLYLALELLSIYNSRKRFIAEGGDELMQAFSVFETKIEQYAKEIQKFQPKGITWELIENALNEVKKVSDTRMPKVAHAHIASVPRVI